MEFLDITGFTMSHTKAFFFDYTCVTCMFFNMFHMTQTLLETIMYKHWEIKFKRSKLEIWV